MRVPKALSVLRVRLPGDALAEVLLHKRELNFVQILSLQQQLPTRIACAHPALRPHSAIASPAPRTFIMSDAGMAAPATPASRRRSAAEPVPAICNRCIPKLAEDYNSRFASERHAFALRSNCVALADRSTSSPLRQLRI